MVHGSGQHHPRRRVDERQVHGIFRSGTHERRALSNHGSLSYHSEDDDEGRPISRRWWQTRSSYDDDYDDFMLRGVGTGTASNNNNIRAAAGLWADEDDRHRQRRPNFQCWGLVMSLLVWIVLMALSGIRAEWTLNAGESRRIEAPILQRQIVVSSPNVQNLDAVVYNLQDGCPPLTGKPITVKDSRSISLGLGDFEYDSFFLNAKSTISLTVAQTKGNSAVYIVQGANALKRLENPSKDEDPFGKDIVAQKKASVEQNAELNYTVLENDIYALVYDNALAVADDSQLTVRYTVVMTTYDVDDDLPMCGSLTMDCQIDRPSRGTCLLVKAKRSPKNRSADVKVKGKRRWLPILVYSVLPYLLCMLAARLYKPASTYQAVGISGTTEEAAEESSPSLALPTASSELVTIAEHQERADPPIVPTLPPTSDPRWDKK